MPTIKIYHNPNFLDYRGQHTGIVPPIRPVATVEVPEETPIEQALEIAYRQTQHLDDVDGGWWNREDVMLHVRSTSVGDVLEACTESGRSVRRRSDAQGNLFVVESMGFRPYHPKAIRPYHRLAEAYRLLDKSLAQASTGQIVAVASQARDTILYVLEAEGYPNGDLPILSWDNAQPGDLVGSPDIGLFRVISRKLRPKWRAKRLLAHIPNAQIWIDSPRTWAVLVPVKEELRP
ncbi:MAG: hypothetical protein L0332_34445 [Chloroflexi bacterium]|nr:hypothetical protein [Chloroflexota bacterium]